MRELRIGGREESRAQRGIGQPENATPPEDCTIAHPLVFYPFALAFRPVSPCPPVHFSLVLTTTPPVAIYIYIYIHTNLPLLGLFLFQDAVTLSLDLYSG